MNKQKIWEFFVENFKAMPYWLRNATIIAVIIGLSYYFIIRPAVVYSGEKARTEEIYTEIEDLNKKITKIEEIRIANEDMLYNIEEVRGIAQALSELHHDNIDLLLKYFKKTLTPDEYHELTDELTEDDKEYKEKVNEMFEKKSKNHLTNNNYTSEKEKEN